MLTALTESAAELVHRFCSRGFTLTVKGPNLSVSPGSKLTDADRLLIREHKAALLRVLGTVVHTVPEVTRHKETIPADCLSTTSERWDECGIANLVAVARQASLCLDYDSTALTIEGPSSPAELRRLLREQAAGIAMFLEIS